MTAIQEMNQDFRYFPDAGQNPSLPEDKLADIVEAGCPNVWQCQELIQGFDATEHSLTELMEFFECPETTEKICGIQNSQQDKKSNKDKADADSRDRGKNQGAQVPAKFQKGRQNNKKSNKRKRETWWCPLHENDSHDQSDCKVLNAQIEKMKASYKSKRSGGQHTSKKWKRPEKEPEDLNAMMTAAAKKGAQEAMENFQHQNKKAKKTVTFDSEDEYNQFSKLRIDDSDESDDDGHATANSH